ncbi:ABC transporter permease [Catelliglobosispora koreensis]|uniref:ABC transporter permease n=1 Tax=Catelliglobosispora koreensis TaxID=129052 RepID=UPI00036D7BED|nr:hypothetical protein [Catelliglobosispora koreensis]
MNSFTGTGALIRLILRRDRVLLPIWILFMGLLPLSLASGTAALYPTDAGRQGYIDGLAANPMLVMFYGPKPLEPSLGALVFWRSATGIVILAIITLLMVIRHTRVEEEAGRRELLGSAVVGRNAGLAAAVLAASGASVAVGILVALGMMSQDTPAAGSVAMGLAWASAGIIFAAIGAIAAQLSEGAGAARGIGLGIIGVSFAVRGAADMTDTGWLNWLSPLGWSHHVFAYTLDRWWIFGLVAVASLAFTYLAISLSARRDVGAGLLPPRLGRAVASPGFSTPLALAWRLHRGNMWGWTIGLGLVGGALFGGVADSTTKLLADNEQLKEIMARLGGDSVAADMFLAGTMGIGAIAVAAYGISAALKMRLEEASLRSEPVLATSVSRMSWASSHLVFAFLGPLVVMAATGLSAGLVYGASTGAVFDDLPRVLGGALVQLPAIWVLTALTVAAFGLVPRLAPGIGWGALAACLMLGQVGALLGLSQTVLDLSPFTHTPRVPGGEMAWTPMIVLTAIAIVLMAAGLSAFRRRDIPVT